MSVILAYSAATDGSTWIASDTMATSGTLRLECGPKWILHGPWAAGVAGFLRSANLIDENRARLLDGLDGPYDFVDRAQALFRSDGYREEREERGPANFGQVLLLATAGQCWIVGGDFSVAQVPPGQLWAEGSGREIAIGAGHALTRQRPALGGEEIVRRAIDAALAFDTSCGGDAWVAELAPGPTPRRARRARIRHSSTTNRS
jgi:ATP-dependent protease HslVU (ClpYQ) peptidase subunit